MLVVYFNNNILYVSLFEFSFFNVLMLFVGDTVLCYVLETF